MASETNTRTTTTTRVIAAVVRRDGRYLLCRRPAHKRHGGLWEFPGGKLEPGESIVEATRRELAEELGVEVRAVGELLHSAHDPGSAFVIEFHPVEIEGDPRCLEHAALAWVSVGELPAYALAPSDREFVRHLLAAAPPHA